MMLPTITSPSHAPIGLRHPIAQGLQARRQEIPLTRNTIAFAEQSNAPNPTLDFKRTVENSLSQPAVKNVLSKLEKPSMQFLPYEFGGPLSILLSIALNEAIASPRTLEFLVLGEISRAFLSMKGEVPAELEINEVRSIIGHSLASVSEFGSALKAGIANGDTTTQELKELGLYDAAKLEPSTRATLANM